MITKKHRGHARNKRLTLLNYRMLFKWFYLQTCEAIVSRVCGFFTFKPGAKLTGVRFNRSSVGKKFVDHESVRSGMINDLLAL